MRLAALFHIEMVGELAALQVAVSTAAESMLGRLPSDSSVEVVSELATKLLKMEDWRSRLERPAARICDLLLGPPPGRARLTDCLDKVVG
jgi:hypothetical protein